MDEFCLAISRLDLIIFFSFVHFVAMHLFAKIVLTSPEFTLGGCF